MRRGKELQSSPSVRHCNRQTRCGNFRCKDRASPEGHPEGVQEIPSDQEGRFAFSNVPDGQYELRVKSRGFWDAWQPFVVNQSHEERKCSRPIRVVMVPAGGCSYVKNAWKK